MQRPRIPFEVSSRDVIRIAAPASIAFITEPLAGLVDITVIGRLGDAALLGGLVLGALIFDFIFSLAYFLRKGTAGLVAQAVGACDPDDGLMHAVRAVLLGIGIGIGMIALSAPLYWLAALTLAPGPGVAGAFADYFYYRIWSAPFSLINYALLGWFYGRAAVGTGLLLQVLIHGIDITASVVFVYAFHWSVPGAALGTVLGQAIAALLGLYIVARHFGGVRRVILRVVPAQLLDRTALRRMFSLSRDLMIRSAALMAVYLYFAAQGSRMGEVALAANAVLMNLVMVSGYFLDGISQAAEQLIGKSVGANYRPAYDSAYRLSLLWGMVMAAGLALALIFVGGPLIDFMTTSEAVRAMARDYLWLAALTAVTGMPAFIFDGMLTGATLNTTMRNGMLLSGLVFIAAVLPLQAAYGNTGLWIALHGFFLARAALYWFGLERRKPGLFSA